MDNNVTDDRFHYERSDSNQRLRLGIVLLSVGGFSLFSFLATNIYTINSGKLQYCLSLSLIRLPKAKGQMHSENTVLRVLLFVNFLFLGLSSYLEQANFE